MSFELTCDGQLVICRITDGGLHIDKIDKSKDIIDINDIIGVTSPTSVQNSEDGNTEYSVTVAIIDKLESNLWKRKDVVFNGEKDKCLQMMSQLRSMLKSLKRPTKLLVLISPVSGTQTSENIFSEKVKPLFDLAGIETEQLVSEYPTHIIEYVTTCNLDNIDGLVVMGGDGSFNQCVNGIFERSQKSANVDYNDPETKLVDTILPIGHIPTGTGNLISGYCNGGCKDIETSILHIIRGKERKLGVTAVYNDTKWVGNSCILVGFGALADMMKYTESYRWLKTYRYHVASAIYYTFKTIPQFKTKCTLKKRDGSVDITEDELCSLTVGNHKIFNPYDYFGSDLWKEDEIIVKKYHKTSRYNHWHSFISKIIKGPNDVAPDHIEDINAVSLKIEIQDINMWKTNDGQAELLLMVDGEYRNVIASTLNFSLKEPLIRVFSSL